MDTCRVHIDAAFWHFFSRAQRLVQCFCRRESTPLTHRVVDSGLRVIQAGARCRHPIRRTEYSTASPKASVKCTAVRRARGCCRGRHTGSRRRSLQPPPPPQDSPECGLGTEGLESLIEQQWMSWWLWRLMGCLQWPGGVGRSASPPPAQRKHVHR